MSKRLPKLWLRHDVYGNGLHTVWFVVRNPCAGNKHVYTVYRISLTSNTAHVIGRELPLTLARNVVKKDMEVIR